MTLLKTAKQMELYWRYCVLTANKHGHGDIVCGEFIDPLLYWEKMSLVFVSCFGMFTTVTSCYFFMNVLCMNTCSCASCIYGVGGWNTKITWAQFSPLKAFASPVYQLIWCKDLWLTDCFVACWQTLQLFLCHFNKGEFCFWGCGSVVEEDNMSLYMSLDKCDHSLDRWLGLLSMVLIKS